jgi:peptidylprolyl isomerase/peptidyl-prolyl cis-trans isomerase B (cyclophilin B)
MTVQQRKKITAVIFTALTFMLVPVQPVSAGPDSSAVKNGKTGLFSTAPKAGDKSVPEGKHVKIEIENGEIIIELYPDVAPNHVASFKALIAKGFYDGLIFHRVIADFMAQGGDPTGTGRGGPGYTIKAEFNARKHLRGTLSMARTHDPDSAGSQFFICFAPQPYLDGQYTVFGQVTKGMDVVDKIKVGTVMKKLTVLP